MSLNVIGKFLSSLVGNGSSTFFCSLSLFSNGTGNIFDKILNFIFGLLYSIVKWILFVVDCIFAFIEQLCGLDMDFTSLETATSSSSDFIFNLINSGWDIIYPIIRALIGLAAFLIIFFSVIAIIKSQYETTKGGQGGYGEIFKAMFRAFVFLILTPFICIVGIMASNALLQTLYNATNVSNSSSMGSRVFAASSISANSYRAYANNGVRIPIIYDFENDAQILEYYSEHSATSEFAEYLTSSNNVIYATYVAFNNNNFISYDSINTILHSSSTDVADAEEAYYSVYDIPTGASGDTSKRIVNYMEEYYVMADVIDTAMANSSSIYFMTIEDIVASFPDGDAETTLLSQLGNYNIYIDIANSGYTYYINYYSLDDSGNPVIPMQVEYNHVTGATDEAYGAKYIVAIKKTSVINGNSYTYYWPLISGSNEESFGSFSSDYIANGQVIAAKGIFDSSIYPTAITKDEDGNIQFYRDTIDSIAVGMASDLFSYSFSSSDGGFFSRIFSFVKSLFSADNLSIDVNFDFDSVNQTYSADVTTIQELSGSKMTVCYFMASGGTFSSVTSTHKTSSYYGINVSNIYNIEKMNYLVLLFGSALLVKVCFSVILNLVGRAFELFLMFVFYPTACAVLPIDNGSYNRWLTDYLQRLFGTYGLILGINFIFILFPVIESIEFFTAAEVANTKIIRKIGSITYSVFTYQQIANFLNFLVAILCELIALSMLQIGSDKDENGERVKDSLFDIVSNMVGGVPTEGADQAFRESVRKTAKVISAPVEIPAKLTSTALTGATKLGKGVKEFAGKSAKDKVFSTLGMAAKVLPGSAIIKDAESKAQMHKKHKEENQKKKQEINDLKNATGMNEFKQEQKQAKKEQKASNKEAKKELKALRKQEEESQK